MPAETTHRCKQKPHTSVRHSLGLRYPTFGGCGIVSVRRAKRSARLFFSSSALKAKLNCEGLRGRQAALSVALQVVQWILTISIRLPAQHACSAMPNKHSLASVW